MPNDNPDWARLDVGRISTIRGASLQVATVSTVNFDATFTDPLIWTVRYNFVYFNPTVAGNAIGIQGSPSGSFLTLLHIVTPNASNLLYNWGEDVVFTSAMDLTLLLAGDTSYQLQVRSGATVATGAWGVSIYAGAQL